MNLALAILQTLEAAHPYLMARQVLSSSLRIAGRDDTAAELDKELRDLEARKQISAVRNPDAPGGWQYKITNDGIVRLREANL